jgi:Fe-S cluster biogenesis protein NfuA
MEGVGTTGDVDAEAPSLADMFAPASGEGDAADQVGGPEDGASDDKRQRLAEIETVLEELRPYIQMDGGDIELIDVTDDGVVQVRMHGACVGCSASMYTLQLGVEQRLKESIPGIRYVEAV